MSRNDVIESVRAVILAVSGHGTIDEAYGGFGGFLGLDVAALAGTSVFDHIPADETDELAIYFIENADESAVPIALPMPFRVSVVDADGLAHPVDVITTGRIRHDDTWRWTVLLVPVALNVSITRSLDLEMEGAPRDEVRKMLCEELLVDNANYTSRWMLIDLERPEHPNVVTARAEDDDVAAAVRSDVIEAGWTPWREMAAGQTNAVALSTIGPSTSAVMNARGWQRCIIAPVFVRDRVVAVFLLVGRVPEQYPADWVKANVAARIQTLVRATALLFERWEDQDHLELAASTDVLTGLANRRALLSALADNRRHGFVLYIDVDDFKSVNDSYGHEVGDAVLIAVADRIAAACRAGDIAGRLGGDEFVILLHGADANVASLITQRVLDIVGEPLDIDGGPSRVSVSVGRASLDHDNPLDIADQAMLRAKRARLAETVRY